MLLSSVRQSVTLHGLKCSHKMCCKPLKVQPSSIVLTRHVLECWICLLWIRLAGGKTKRLSQSDRKRIAQSSGAASSDVVLPSSGLAKVPSVLTPAKENKAAPSANPWSVAFYDIDCSWSTFFYRLEEFLSLNFLCDCNVTFLACFRRFCVCLNLKCIFM